MLKAHYDATTFRFIGNYPPLIEWFIRLTVLLEYIDHAKNRCISFSEPGQV